MAFPRHYQTPEQDDYKIARFAQLGLMPTAMKSDPYFPAMNWSGSTGMMEIDSSRRDRLSNSAQKKFRRWSRRLNGQHANGSGWVMRHDPARPRVQTAPRPGPRPGPHQDHWGPYSRPSPVNDKHRQGRHEHWRRPRSHSRPTFSPTPRPYDADVAVSRSPRRDWFLRSERRLFNHRPQARDPRDDEPLATELPPHPDPAAHATATTCLRRSPRKDSRSCTEPASTNTRRSRQGEHEELDDAVPPAQTESGAPLSRHQGRRSESDKCDSQNETPITAASPDIVKELRGRRVESPSKVKPSILPLDADTFFGTKDKSRRSSADHRDRAPIQDKPRRPSLDLCAANVDTSRSAESPLAETVAHPSHSKPKPTSARRRRSSQDSDICIIAVIEATGNRDEPVAETPRTSAPKSAKKSTDRGGSLGTPASFETSAGTKTEHATRDKAPARRSSPSGDLRPKAIIKPGLRSAKKDQTKARTSLSKTPAGKTDKRRSSPRKSTSPQRKLVQRTLDSFFSKAGSQGSQSPEVADGRTEERRSSARKVPTDAARPAVEDAKAHVRRIFEDKKPIVSVTPLEVERRLLQPGATGAVASARLAHVTPITSPAKKRGTQEATSPSVTSPGAASPPRKVTRRALAEDAMKYVSVRDLSPSCPLKKVFSVSRVVGRSEAPDDGSVTTRHFESRASKKRQKGEKTSPHKRGLSTSGSKFKETNEPVGDASRPLDSLSKDEEKEKNRTSNDENKKRSSPRKLSKKYKKWKRSPSKKSILGPSDLSSLFRKAYLQSKSEDGAAKIIDADFDSVIDSSSVTSLDSICTTSAIPDIKEQKSKSPTKDTSLEKSPRKSQVSHSDSLRPKPDAVADKIRAPNPAALRPSPTKCDAPRGFRERFVRRVAAGGSPTKPGANPCSPVRQSPTRASDCGSPAQVPSSEPRTLRSATPRKPSPSEASPAETQAPPRSAEEVEPEVVTVQPEEELLQAQQDRAARAAEAVKAAQRNKQRHTRGHKVYEYCPALDEHLERHPAQNEVPADKWFKWLNPTQLRCLTLAMLNNTDLCLRFTAEGPAVDRWEAEWVELSRRLNTICFNKLTNLNTGLRLTVMEWKKLWLDMRSLIKSRVDAMTPSQRRHGLGSLECLLHNEDLYAALVKSKGECLGAECPRVWCSGACVGVVCPTTEPTLRRAAEE